MISSTTEKNPAFCFMMVVWGERYRKYFAEYCLPSLLAQNNIPCLINKAGSNFAIATTPEDWDELNKLPVFQALRSYIEPIFLELPPFTPSDPKMLVMSSGHKKLSNFAFTHKAYGVNVNPDTLFSDHMISDLQAAAQRGVKMVMYPGFRFEMEGIVDELELAGYLKDPTKITISPRTAAGLALRNKHPFTLACNWDDDHFFEFPVYHFVEDKTQPAMIFNSISMGPLMLDYSIINEHRDEIFDKWTLDGDYAYSNFGNLNLLTEIDYVSDSDRFMILSLTPKNEEVPPRVALRGGRLAKRLQKGSHLWRVYTHPVTDPLKKRLYLRQVVIHENNLGSECQKLSSRARKIIQNHVLSRVEDKSILSDHSAYERITNTSHFGSHLLGRSEHLSAIRGLYDLRARSIRGFDSRISWVICEAWKQGERVRLSIAKSTERFAFVRARATFYVAHYSAQGPAHARFYYYRTVHFILSRLSKARARLRLSGHPIIRSNALLPSDERHS